MAVLAALEVVVLAFGAFPTAIWESEGVFVLLGRHPNLRGVHGSEHGLGLLLDIHWFKIVHFLGKFRNGLSGDKGSGILIQLQSSSGLVVGGLKVFIECVQEIVAKHVDFVELWGLLLAISLQGVSDINVEEQS